MNYETISVRLPNGEIRNGQLMSKTKNGFRTVQVNYNGERFTGRVSSRQGWKAPIHHKLQVRFKDAWMFYDDDDFVAQ